MSTAIFIGHAECPGLKPDLVEEAIRKLIEGGVDHFLCGGKGQFDNLCAALVHRLKREFPQITSELVLPYPGFDIPDPGFYDGLIAPEGYEAWYKKAVYEKRNKYLVEHADIALCYVNHSWGGAAKTLKLAEKRGLTVVRL